MQTQTQTQMQTQTQHARRPAPLLPHRSARRWSLRRRERPPRRRRGRAVGRAAGLGGLPPRGAGGGHRSIGRGEHLLFRRAASSRRPKRRRRRTRSAAPTTPRYGRARARAMGSVRIGSIGSDRIVDRIRSVRFAVRFAIGRFGSFQIGIGIGIGIRDGTGRGAVARRDIDRSIARGGQGRKGCAGGGVGWFVGWWCGGVGLVG